MKLFMAAFFAVAAFWLYQQNISLTVRLDRAHETITQIERNYEMAVEEMNSVVEQEQIASEQRRLSYEPARKRIADAPAKADAPVSGVLRQAIEAIPE